MLTDERHHGRRHLGGDIMEEASWRRHLGGGRHLFEEHLGCIWGASGRHLGGIWETPGGLWERSGGVWGLSVDLGCLGGFGS